MDLTPVSIPDDDGATLGAIIGRISGQTPCGEDNKLPTGIKLFVKILNLNT